MSKLGEALRQKFKTPQQVIEKLGLDESCLVSVGLANDSKEKVSMAKTRPKMTRQAAIAVSVLSSYLRPRLAADAKLSLLPIVTGITAGNFRDKKPSILAGVKKQLKLSPAALQRSGKTPKLAMDATIGEVAELLDMIENHGVEGDAEELVDMPEAMNEIGNPAAAPMPPVEVKGVEAEAKPGELPMEKKEEEVGHDDPVAEVKSLLQGKVDDATIAKVCQLVGGEAAEAVEEAHDVEGGEEKLEELGAADDLMEDPNSGKGTGTGKGSPGGSKEGAGLGQAKDALEENPNTDKGTGTGKGSPGGGPGSAQDEADEDEPKGAKDTPPPFKGMPKVGGSMVTQDAMNAAIKAATDAERKRQRDIRDAERDVRPWVGEMSMAFDSAEAVYKAALDMAGVKDIGNVDVKTYQAILKLVPRPGQRMNAAASRDEIAMDSAEEGAASYDEMFPDAARIGIL